MAVFKSAAELVGNTPMIEALNLEKQLGLGAKLFAKLEYFNPSGSVKDRIAKSIIEEAEKNGSLKPGSVIIEPTSGNTGIGIASVAAAKGYRAIIVMPDTMSIERINIIKAYGAEIVLTDGSLGMKGAIEKAEELRRENEGSIIAGQFTNPVNPLTHEKTTGPEIFEDLGGKVDIFVAGVGTGGTLSGCARFLKKKNPETVIVAVEPASSPVISQGKAGSHGIQGIGAGFIPETLDVSLIDEVITVEDKSAIDTAKLFSKAEGVLVGISSGAALFGATELAKKEENAGKNIAVILPDGGDRYFSTELFKD